MFTVMSTPSQLTEKDDRARHTKVMVSDLHLQVQPLWCWKGKQGQGEYFDFLRYIAAMVFIQ